jgi:recombination protein RecR
MTYPRALERLVEEFTRFPGVGRRTAERLAFHVLRSPEEWVRAFAAAAVEARVKTLRCRQCHNTSERDPCAICADPARDHAVLCVVEQPKDVDALERAGVFGGLYHVLMGAWNPAEGTDREQLTLDALSSRARAPGIREVIVATDPDLEGDATALAVRDSLRGAPVKITRLAKGLPTGTGIEYLNRSILADAFEGRRDL